jgi:hypothetical protein
MQFIVPEDKKDYKSLFPPHPFRQSWRNAQLIKQAASLHFPSG